MLIEFSVTNFCSILEKQTISMVANNSDELSSTHILNTEIKNLTRLLPCAVVYGANASGKSNLIDSMGVMRQIILDSADKGQEGQVIAGIEPHALAKNSPTEFEIFFILENVRYQYGFAATKERIVEEWLYAYPHSRAQRWLEREFDEELNSFDWYINADKVKGARELWKDSTRDNALFLSCATQLNSEQFKPLINWFRQNLQGGQAERVSESITLKTCEDESKRQQILDFLNEADLSIADINITREDLNISNLSDALPAELKKSLLQKITEINSSSENKVQKIEVSFSHSTEQGENFSLEYSRESDGTHRMFELAGIWLHVLKHGYVLRLDELERSLHPLLARYLISLFHDPEVNKNNAQLIVTTHDSSILDKFLRRDQYWLIEKDRNQASSLCPLSDFKPRDNEALQKNYLQGRYGALPYINS